jgi:SAM-dependent methyltransferase
MQVHVQLLDWHEVQPEMKNVFDFVIASDVCYRSDGSELLVDAIADLLKDTGKLWLVTPNKRQGVEPLLATLRSRFWEVTRVPASASMYLNPLASGSDAEFVSYFFRFFQDEFVLIQALKPP